MTARARHSSYHRDMAISLNLRVTAITVRDPDAGLYHSLHVPGARLALPLALDSLFLPRYSTHPLSANRLLSMTVLAAQEGLCCADCCRPLPAWARRFSPCVSTSC